MKKILATLLLSMLAQVVTLPTANAAAIEVEFSDASMGLSRYPFMQGGTLMVPLREMAENLNFLVGWDQKDNAATLLKVNQEAKIYAGSDKSIINGKEFKLPSNTINVDGTLYCPIAFIKELSGLDFAWDYDEKVLTILANSSEFNAFSFAKKETKKRIVIKNPMDPSKYVSVEAAGAYACYPSKEDVYITEECVVQECKSPGNGAWGYSKYDTKELKAVLAQIKDQCEVRFWAKATSEEGNSVFFTVKSGGPAISYTVDVDNQWKEYSVILDWNPQIDANSAYALIGMKRFVAGEKVYIDGLSINPVE